MCKGWSLPDQYLTRMDESLYTKIVDGVDLGWDDSQVLILAPQNHYSHLAPPGFNQHNIHSIDYFTKKM